jgi:tetratricopeptide (TPR) repeat protein
VDAADRTWRRAVHIATATHEIDGNLQQAERFAVAAIIKRRHEMKLPTAVGAAALPTPCDPLVGRSDIVTSTAETIATASCNIAITGPPGVGKTEFAAALLHSELVVDAFTDRFWVQCDAATSESLLYNSVCRAVGIPTSENPTADIVGMARHSTKPIFVFDGIDAPWRTNPSSTEGLLKRLAPFSHLVVTTSGSQRPAGVAWTTIRVPPFSMEQCRELFEIMLEQHVPSNFHEALWKATDGLPLAIISLAQEAQQEPNIDIFIQDVYAQSITTPRRLADRLEAALALVATTPSEQQSLLRLALCPDGLDLSDVDGACEIDSALRRRAIGSGLVHEVPYLETPSGKRYRLRVLEPLRRHITLTRRSDGAHTDQTLQCLLRHVAQKALSLDKPEGAVTSTALSLLTLRWDLANYLALLPLLPWHDEESLQRRILSIGAVLRWARRIGVDTSDPLLTDLESKIPASRSSPVAALIDIVHGDFAHAAGDFVAARAWFRSAADAAPPMTLIEANAKKRLADTHFCLSDLDAAYPIYQEAIESYDAAGSDLGKANSLLYMAELSLRYGKPDVGLSQLGNALDLYDRVHDNLGAANCHFLQCEAALVQFDPLRARNMLNAVQTEYRSLGADLGEANCLIRLAELAMINGDVIQCDAHLRAAELLANSTRNSLSLGHVTELKARRLSGSDASASVELYEQAALLYNRAGDFLGASWSALHRSTLEKPTAPFKLPKARTPNQSIDGPENSIAVRDFRYNALMLFMRSIKAGSSADDSQLKAAFAKIPSDEEKATFEAALLDNSFYSLLQSVFETRSFQTFTALPML